MSHFNDKALTWDGPQKIQMMQKLASETMKKLHLKEKVDILDFGCGTGLFGLEFADFAKSLTGIDTSEGMLSVFDKKTSGVHHIKSLKIDLEKENLSQKFDLILSSMAFHHLENPEEVLGKLKGMLNKGGRIAIADLDQEDGTFHPDNKGMGVKHFGFSKDLLESWAKKQGLIFSHFLIHNIQKNSRDYLIFLAIYQII